MTSGFTKFLKAYLSEQLSILLLEEVELEYEGTEIAKISSVEEIQKWREQIKKVLPDIISQTLDEVSDDFDINEKSFIENPIIFQTIYENVLKKLKGEGKWVYHQALLIDIQKRISRH